MQSYASILSGKEEEKWILDSLDLVKWKSRKEWFAAWSNHLEDEFISLQQCLWWAKYYFLKFPIIHKEAIIVDLLIKGIKLWLFSVDLSFNPIRSIPTEFIVARSDVCRNRMAMWSVFSFPLKIDVIIRACPSLGPFTFAECAFLSPPWSHQRNAISPCSFLGHCSHWLSLNHFSSSNN